jgi:hypothetical protein
MGASSFSPRLFGQSAVTDKTFNHSGDMMMNSSDV